MVFHSAGNKTTKVRMDDPYSTKTQRHIFFSGSSDWKIVFDEDDRQRSFPNNITSTSRRPGVVIYTLTRELCNPGEEMLVKKR